MQTGLVTIDENMKVAEAREIASQLEVLYDTHYGELEGTWTWNDTHPLDHDAFTELYEVIRADQKPPIDVDIFGCFRTVDWRTEYLSPSKKEPVSA